MASADGEAASMASAASGAASMASADLRQVRAAELHPWRAGFLGKHGRPARAPTGDEERRGGASSSAIFSRGYGVVSAALRPLQFFLEN